MNDCRMKHPTFEFQDNFPDGLRSAIGDVVIAFGRLEYTLMLCYKTLKGEGFMVGMAEIVKRGRMLRNLCTRVEELATEDRLPEPHRTKLLGLVAAAKELTDERNHIIHACWTSYPDGGVNRVRPFIPKREDDVEWSERSGPVPMADLKALAARADVLWKTINTARRKEWPKPGGPMMANAAAEIEGGADLSGSNAIGFPIVRAE